MSAARLPTVYRSVSFTVPGEPATQGSTKAFVVNGRARIVHDSAKTMPWRRAVRSYAFAVFREAPWDFPVRVRAEFVLTKPPSRLKRDTEPDRKPDLDKLCRALGDALEGVVIKQDSRIVEWRARKRYAVDEPPHVVVVVEAIG